MGSRNCKVVVHCYIQMPFFLFFFSFFFVDFQEKLQFRGKSNLKIFLDHF